MQVIHIQFGWIRWIGEALVRWLEPNPWRELLATGLIEINLDADGLRIVRRRQLARPLAPRSMLHSAATAPLLAPWIKRGSKFALSIEESLWLRRDVRVPAGARRQIAAMLSLDVERVTPFRRDEVLSIHRIMGLDRPRSELLVRHYVLKKAILAPLIETVERRAAKISAITIRPATAAALPVAETLAGGTFGDRQFKSWAAAAGLALAALMMIFLAVTAAEKARTESDLALLAHSIEQLEPKASAIRQRLNELTSRTELALDLETWRVARANPVTVLEELSRLLPDDTYLDSLIIEGQRIAVEGQSRNPEILVGTLEGSPLLKNAVLTSPISRRPGDDGARFSIGLEAERPPLTEGAE